MKRRTILIALTLLVMAALLLYRLGRPLWKPVAERVGGQRALEK
jgi:hypothetical protein